MIRPDTSILRKLNILIAHNIENSNMSADYICKEIGVSRSQLHRILKNETQLSLSHFIRRKRLERAKKLLSNSELRISEVADAVGINSHQNFTKYFTSTYGINPSQYRAKQARKKSKDLPNKENTIAVLPFVNFSNDREQEYFSDGITEEIINVLAQAPFLKVVGRTSAFAFKNKLEDLRVIGTSLDVNYILEGSVRRAGDNLRITAQLIQVNDGFHLWSQKYDCELNNIFQVQDEISASINKEITNELLEGENYKFSKRKSRDPEAHEYYLKGLYFLNKFGATENFYKSIVYFERAVAIDPDYIECLSGMASCYIQLWFFSQVATSESIEKAMALLERANKLMPNTPSVMVREAHIKTWYYWDMPGAKELLEKAILMAPNNIEAYMHMSMTLTYLGEYDRAEATIKQGINLDPLSGILQFAHAFIMWYKGDFEKGIKILDKLIAFKPGFWGGHYFKGVFLLETYRSKEAIPYGKKAIQLFPSSMTYALLAQAYLLSAEFKKAKSVVATIEKQIDQFPVSNFDLGHLFMGLGEFEKSRDYLQKALEAREGRMLFLIPSCRKLKMIHAHPYYRPFFDHMRSLVKV